MRDPFKTCGRVLFFQHCLLQISENIACHFVAPCRSSGGPHHARRCHPSVLRASKKCSSQSKVFPRQERLLPETYEASFLTSEPSKCTRCAFRMCASHFCNHKAGSPLPFFPRPQGVHIYLHLYLSIHTFFTGFLHFHVTCLCTSMHLCQQNYLTFLIVFSNIQT